MAVVAVVEAAEAVVTAAVAASKLQLIREPPYGYGHSVLVLLRLLVVPLHAAFLGL